jgi:hypothetical protein
LFRNQQSSGRPEPLVEDRDRALSRFAFGGEAQRMKVERDEA